MNGKDLAIALVMVGLAFLAGLVSRRGFSDPVQTWIFLLTDAALLAVAAVYLILRAFGVIPVSS